MEVVEVHSIHRTFLEMEYSLLQNIGIALNNLTAKRLLSAIILEKQQLILEYPARYKYYTRMYAGPVCSGLL
jgi:hypothetical protein